MNDKNKYGGFFFSPNEKQICTIGTGYISNIISNAGAKQAGATLTNKRIYFSGSVYSVNHKGRFVAYNQRKICDNRDITGTGYVYYRPLYFIWWSVISLILGFLSMAILMNSGEDVFVIPTGLGFALFISFLITYFIKRMTLLTVEYAGGNIAFDVRWIQKHEQDDFIRNIHLTKDNLYSNSAVTQGFVNELDESDLIPEL